MSLKAFLEKLEPMGGGGGGGGEGLRQNTLLWNAPLAVYLKV